MSTLTPLGARTSIFQAKSMWAEAALAIDATERYRLAHLAALRGAAAVLAAHPVPSRRGRPTSAWRLIETAIPELANWSAFFADSAVRRSAIEAGSTTAVRPEDADELVSVAGGFLAVATEFITESAQRFSAAGRGAPGVSAPPASLSIAS